jgi:hypothetical protein
MMVDEVMKSRSIDFFHFTEHQISLSSSCVPVFVSYYEI